MFDPGRVDFSSIAPADAEIISFIDVEYGERNERGETLFFRGHERRISCATVLE